MNIRVSVIVPVYNGEDYLERSIDSIVKQTEKQIQIILVNDGSTDGSGVICDKWKEKDARILVIHQRNKGLTVAWKTGVLAALGEFVGFVDCDDYIAADMYERMYETAIQKNAEVVCCGIRHIFEDKEHMPWDDEMKLPGEEYTSEEMMKQVFPVLLNDGSFMGRGLQPNRVSKIVKRELVLESMSLCDNKVTVGEDFQFSFSIFPKVKKFVILKNYLPYYYWINKNSMTGTYDVNYLDKIKLMKKNLERINQYYQIYDFKEQIQNDFLCLAVLHIKGGIMEHRKERYGESRKRMKSICEDGIVREVLKTHTMTKLGGAEKAFLYFMKHRLYFAIYSSVKFYFNLIH